MFLSSKSNSLKNLGSIDRSGGYSRRVVLDAVKDFARPNWALLLIMMLLPGAIGYVMTLFSKGSERVRWMYLGSFGISGVWLVIIFVIIWTGIGNPLMGLEGENRTAVILRKFQKSGWQLVNGLRLRGDWDIDHVLVGPAGVLVFESKWSHKLWPTDDRDSTFMAGRLEDATRQVNRNCAQFKSFFKEELVGVTVTPVCVLWSNTYKSDVFSTFQSDGVVVVPGPSLESWMESLTANWLDPNRVEQLSNVVALQVALRDKEDAERSDAPLPTLGTLVKRNVFAPLFGLFVALYGYAVITRHQGLWFSGFMLATFAVIGVLLARRLPSRRIGQGWLWGCAVYVCVFIVVLIQAFTR
jgi:hypothetical protein